MNEITPLEAATGRLTEIEVKEFQEHETTIEVGLKGFIQVGQSLLAIHTKRLYREQFSTFEEYTQKRWGYSRNRAYQLMEAVPVAHAITDAGLQPPTSERQVRPLAKLPKEEQVEAWKEVVAEAGEIAPTSAQVHNVVTRRTRKRKTDSGEPERAAEVIASAVAKLEHMLKAEIQTIELDWREAFFKAMSDKLSYHRTLSRFEKANRQMEQQEERRRHREAKASIKCANRG